MEIPPDLQRQIAAYQSLRRWDRAELGRALRRLGMTYREIMDLIPVAKGTLAGWCRDIHLSDAQVEAMRARSSRGVPVDTQRKRRREIEAIRMRAIAEVDEHMADPLWVAGTVLYWAEGTKSRPGLQLANSDPTALRVFMQWSRAFHDACATFSGAINLHEANDEVAARGWWSAQLGLDSRDFTKTFVKPDGTGHRKNHLPHGVCRVTMRRSTDAWHRTMGWIEGLRGRVSSASW